MRFSASPRYIPNLPATPVPADPAAAADPAVSVTAVTDKGTPDRRTGHVWGRKPAPSWGVPTRKGAPPPAPTGYVEYPEGEIFIDPDRLPSADDILVQWRQGKERSVQEEIRRTRRARRNRVFIGGWIVLGAMILGAHAASQTNSYDVATVAAVTGPAFIQAGNRQRTLHAGERIDLVAGHSLPIFVTGTGGRLVLSLRGAQMHLLEDSALAVRDVDYRKAPIRRFELQNGGVVAHVDPYHRAGAVFEIRAGGVRALVKGTRYGVILTGNSRARRAVVATQEGSVRVVRGGGNSERLVGGGTQLSAVPGIEADDTALPAPVMQEEAIRDLLARSANTMAGLPEPNRFLTWISGAEERMVRPLVETVTVLTRLPTYLNDRRAILNALGGMQALCTLVQTTGSSEEGPPLSVHLDTLEELGMTPKDRRRILNQFQDLRLTRYRRFLGGGYEFTARARDSERSLIRGRNGAAYLVGNDDTAGIDSQ